MNELDLKAIWTGIIENREYIADLQRTVLDLTNRIKDLESKMEFNDK